jgi:UMF1 family MFS transporter
MIGCLAGMGLGATQSASRAIVGLFSPESKSAEFFGFWGLSGKLAAIVGLLAIGLMQKVLGLQNAILLCSLFFFLALLVNFFVNYQHGMKAALRHQGE